MTGRAGRLLTLVLSAALLLTVLEVGEAAGPALQVLGSVLVIVAAIPANRIVWRYRFVPWRETALGRVLHSKSTSIAVVLNLAIVSSVCLLLGYRPLWLEAIRLAAFGYVAVALWRQDLAYGRIVTEAQQAAGRTIHHHEGGPR